MLPNVSRICFKGCGKTSRPGNDLWKKFTLLSPAMQGQERKPRSPRVQQEAEVGRGREGEGRAGARLLFLCGKGWVKQGKQTNQVSENTLNAFGRLWATEVVPSN